MSKQLADKVKAALKLDNTIVVDAANLQDAQGFTEDHMQYLGLDKRDLKNLERKGLAARGYLKTNKGNRRMWILVGSVK